MKATQDLKEEHSKILIKETNKWTAIEKFEAVFIIISTETFVQINNLLNKICGDKRKKKKKIGKRKEEEDDLLYSVDFELPIS